MLPFESAATPSAPLVVDIMNAGLLGYLSSLSGVGIVSGMNASTLPFLPSLTLPIRMPRFQPD